jgi:hypothetical protein
MNIKSIKGMTLVEVIATVAIMAAIMIPISLIFTTAYSNFIAESDKSTAQKSARAVLYGKGLYGNGLISYGVMGDLQRSNVGISNIKIDLLDAGNPNKGRSIAITGDDNKTKRYSFIGGILYYEPDVSDLSKVDPKLDDIYLDEKSSNDREVKVLDFIVEKKIKGIDKDPTTQALLENDLIVVYVKVECGQSGKIDLESSYRIPIE